MYFIAQTTPRTTAGRQSSPPNLISRAGQAGQGDHGQVGDALGERERRRRGGDGERGEPERADPDGRSWLIRLILNVASRRRNVAAASQGRGRPAGRAGRAPWAGRRPPSPAGRGCRRASRRWRARPTPGRASVVQQQHPGPGHHQGVRRDRLPGRQPHQRRRQRPATAAAGAAAWPRRARRAPRPREPGLRKGDVHGCRRLSATPNTRASRPRPRCPTSDPGPGR